MERCRRRRAGVVAPGACRDQAAAANPGPDRCTRLRCRFDHLRRTIAVRGRFTSRKQTGNRPCLPFGRWMSSWCGGRANEHERDDLVAEGRLRLLLVEDGSEPPVMRGPERGLGPGPRRRRRRAVPRRGAAAPLGGQRRARCPSSIPTASCATRAAGSRCRRSRPASWPRCSIASAPWSAASSSPSSGWPRGAPGRNALDVHMLRLRRRIAPVGLAIKTVRSRGYLLEAAPTGGRGRARGAPAPRLTAQR